MTPNYFNWKQHHHQQQWINPHIDRIRGNYLINDLSDEPYRNRTEDVSNNGAGNNECNGHIINYYNHYNNINCSSMGNALIGNQTQNQLCEDITNYEWEYQDVYLDLSKKGLGITIRGGIDSPNNGHFDIYISRILDAGAVHDDGRLKLGDVIVQVNEIPLEKVTHKQAVSAILNAGPYIHFRIKRRKYVDSSEIYEQINDDGSEDDPLIGGNNPPFYLHNEEIAENHRNRYDNCIKVELVRNESGFGFSIGGGLDNEVDANDTGIYVNNIIQNGPAHLNGQIAIGDEIVAINGTNLERVPYQWALDVIRKSPNLSIFTVRKRILWE